MAFEVYKSKENAAYFTVLLISIPLTVLALILRFVATRSAGRKPALEDWLALSALIVFLVRVGVALAAAYITNGRGAMLAFDRPAYEEVFKMVYVCDMITTLDQTLAKLSICAFYLRLFGVKTRYRVWVYLIAGLQVASYIALAILQSLQCRPLHKFWQYWADGDCLDFSVILVAIEPPNSFVDFALVILAIFMIRSLKIKVEAKWKLGFLFGLGSLAGVFGFVKLGISYNWTPETIVVLGLWAVVQSVACIICACAPVYGRLPPVSATWNQISSLFSNVSLRSLVSSRSRKTGGEFPYATGTGGGSMHTQEEDLLRNNGQSSGWVVASHSQVSTVHEIPMKVIQVKKQVDVV